MAYYDNNPDYTLRWPQELFAQEVELLVRRGDEMGAGSDWQEEVTLLLRQAFVSPIPADDFEKVVRAQTQARTAQAVALAEASSSAQACPRSSRRRLSAVDDEPF